MAYKALTFDATAINRFLSGLGMSDEWWKDFKFGDENSSHFSFFVDDYCYVLTKDSRMENPRLVIKLDDTKLFSGLVDETDKMEALHRCVSAAQRFFEGKNPIPHSWKPYSKDDIKSFQSNNKTSGETRRIVTRFTASGTRSVYAFDLTSTQAEFDAISVDEVRFREANYNFARAVEDAVTHFSTLQTSIEDIPLGRTFLAAIPAEIKLEEIIDNHLTNEQKRFVKFPLSPIRLSGAAGTGKTFAMVVKLLREAYQRIDASEQFRFLFLTHNTTAKDLVDSYIDFLDRRTIVKADNLEWVIQTDTLLSLAYNYLAAELSNVEPISIDAHVGKKLQLDFISDIVAEYRRGAWLTRRSRASEQMKTW